jgi:hypothetical protein
MDSEFQAMYEALLKQGRFDEIPTPCASETEEDFEPIPIQGKPISEEIIEGQR